MSEAQEKPLIGAMNGLSKPKKPQVYYDAIKQEVYRGA